MRRRCSEAESVRRRAAGCSLGSTSSSVASARDRSSRSSARDFGVASTVRSAPPKCRRTPAPASTFSSAVMLPNTAVRCSVRTTPTSTRAAMPSPFSHGRRARPGRRRDASVPERMRSAVVFPDPFGPMRATIGPGCASSSRPSSATTPPKRFRTPSADRVAPRSARAARPRARRRGQRGSSPSSRRSPRHDPSAAEPEHHEDEDCEQHRVEARRGQPLEAPDPVGELRQSRQAGRARRRRRSRSSSRRAARRRGA